MYTFCAILGTTKESRTRSILRVTKERQVPMQYRIQYVLDHVEVYDAAGRFLFSADTQQEALDELQSLNAA